MAVTGSNRILRSNTASAVPSSLEEGQLAINHADRRLYFRGPSGAVESIDLGFNAALKANLASPLFTGQVQIGQGHSLRFPHASQADAADGTIGAGIYGSGLNIVGVQTGAGLGRQIRLWGVLHAQEGLFVGHSGYNGAIAIDGAANSWRVLDFRHAGVLHWRLQATGDGNKNFVIAAQNDAGVFLRNALVIDRATGALAITGDVAATGTLNATSYVAARLSGSTGYSLLNTGDTTRPGYLAWHTPDGLRRGYIGWKSSAGDFLQINLENGWGLEINGTVRFNSVPLFRGGLGGAEGGEIAFERPASGTTLAGNVTQDVNGDRLRVFESGGSFRGFHVDLATCAASGGTKLWHQGNDGAGSGLDADTLDGLHASSFITTSSPNLTGTPTVSSNPIWHDGNTLGAPAYIKDAAIRPREAWDNATFRAAVKAGNDASNGLEEVINQPGRIRMPDQAETIKINRRLSMYEHGTRLEGTRLGTRIYFTAANCGIDVKGLYHVEIDGVSFSGGYKAGAAVGGVIPTGGAAIGTGLTPQNTGCHDLQLRNITFDGVFNAIDGYAVNKLICEDMYIRDVYGTHGIRIYGSSAALRSDLFHVNRVGVDNPTPYPYSAPQFRGAWAAGTPYMVSDVVSSNSRFYQCLYTAVSGAINPFTSTPDGTVAGGLDIFDENAVGGIQIWRRLFRTSLAGLIQDSYASSLETDSFVALNVPYGFRMLDSVGAANGASEPIWAYLHNSDFEHNAYNGVLLSHGSGFRSNLGYIGVTKGGAGLHVAAAYRGEGSWQNGEIRLNAQQGAAIYAPFSILSTLFASNGQSGTPGQYDQILVGGNVNYVQIIGNTFCPAAKVESINGPMAAARPIRVNAGTAHRLMIVGNQAWGHHNGQNAVLNSSTGTGQIIANNSP